MAYFPFLPKVLVKLDEILGDFDLFYIICIIFLY